MSIADPFSHPDMGKQVDATAAASALHDILSALGTPGGGGGSLTGAKDLFSSAPDVQQPTADPVTAQPTAAVPSASDDSTLTDPVPQGTGVSQPYGGGHPGIDLAVPLDTRLLAAQSGTVTVASNEDPGGYGLEVEIATADGHHIRYGHLHSTTLHVGDRVKAGQPIGTSGGEAGGANSGNSTGAHLHFEVRGPDGNTVDPTPWLAGGHAIVDAAPSSVTTMTPTPLTPEQVTSTSVKNVVAGLTGQPMQDDPHNPDTATTTTTGQKGTGSTSDTDPGAVEAFLNATKQHESGGDYHVYNQSGQSNASGAYQFIGTTWRGMGGSTQNAADASPAEQDAIARKMALQLFNQFHSWRLVAIAWYGGPAVAAQVAAGQNPGSPEGQGPYLDYGNTIVSMMNGGK